MRKDLAGLTPEEKKQLAAELMADAEKPELEFPDWFDGKKVDEVAYIRFASVYRRFTDVNQFLSAITEMVKK